MSNLLIVIGNVPQVVTASIVRLAHRHGIVREVYIAIVAEEFGHFRVAEKALLRYLGDTSCGGIQV